jgi:hypothetical protein
MSDIFSLELFLPSHPCVSFYLDEDIEEEEDKDKDNDKVKDTDLKEIAFEDNKMVKTKEVRAHSPCTPGKTPPQKAPPTVASTEKEMKTMSVAAAHHKLVRFNFNQRFMMIGTNTTYLEDGSCQVYFDYLVNLMVIEHFNSTVSTDGLFLKLQAKVPKAFIDLMARAYAEFDPTYANTLVIQSTVRNTIEAIVQDVGPDFNNIWSKGQIDALSIACHTKPQMQLLWHEGDKYICAKNYKNPNIDQDAKHQLIPILRITSKAQEKQQKNFVHIDDAVLHRHSSYKCGDSASPLPPGCPFSTQPRQSGGGGDGFPSFAMDGRNTLTPTKKYNMSTIAFGGGYGKTSK